MSKRVLCLLAPGFEEIEMITPVDLLRRAGAEVIIASLGGEQAVTGRSKLTLQADVALADIADEDFDLLLVPGGPGVKALRADGRPAKLAKSFYERGKLVAAICAAPAVLKDAKLLESRKFTAHFSVYEELPNALAEEKVVQDGRILTARGAGTALDFGLAVVQTLFGAEKAREVAQSIMA
jgi:4-methyl-5(b-hydroxyethyl)-thiazole monophosphate biosynthesis